MKSFMTSMTFMVVFVSTTSAATLPILGDSVATQQLSFGNFQTSLSTHNYPESSHEHYNNDGSIWVHVIPPSGQVDLFTTIDQFAYGNTIVPFGTVLYVSKKSWDEQALFVSASAFFLKFEEPLTFEMPPKNTLQMSYGDFNLSTSFRTYQETDWIFDPLTGNFTVELREDISSFFSFEMDYGTVTDVEFNVQDHTITNGDVTYPGLQLDVSFTVDYIGDFDDFDFLFPSGYATQTLPSMSSGGGGGSINGVLYDANMNPVISVPEPASFVLASLAVCLMFGASLYELRSRR